MSAELEELKGIALSVRDFRASVLSIQESIFSQMTQLADEANRADLRMQLAVERLSGRICDEFKSLPATREVTALPESMSEDEILVELDRLDKSKDKRAPQFRKVFEIAGKHGLDMSIDEDGVWHFSRHSVWVAKTDGTKTRLDLVVNIPEDQPIQVLPSLENINGKKGGLVINGKDFEKAAARFDYHMENHQEEPEA